MNFLTAPEWLCEMMKKKFHHEAHVHSTQSNWLKPFRNYSEMVIVKRKGGTSRTNNLSILNHGELLMYQKGGRFLGI